MKSLGFELTHKARLYLLLHLRTNPSLSSLWTSVNVSFDLLINFNIL